LDYDKRFIFIKKNSNSLEYLAYSEKIYLSDTFIPNANNGKHMIYKYNIKKDIEVKFPNLSLDGQNKADSEAILVAKDTIDFNLLKYLKKDYSFFHISNKRFKLPLKNTEKHFVYGISFLEPISNWVLIFFIVFLVDEYLLYKPIADYLIRPSINLIFDNKGIEKVAAILIVGIMSLPTVLINLYIWNLIRPITIETKNDQYLTIHIKNNEYANNFYELNKNNICT
jgi:hypothetical protein